MAFGATKNYTARPRKIKNRKNYLKNYLKKLKSVGVVYLISNYAQSELYISTLPKRPKNHTIKEKAREASSLTACLSACSEDGLTSTVQTHPTVFPSTISRTLHLKLLAKNFSWPITRLERSMRHIEQNQTRTQDTSTLTQTGQDNGIHTLKALPVALSNGYPRDPRLPLVWALPRQAERLYYGLSTQGRCLSHTAQRGGVDVTYQDCL